MYRPYYNPNMNNMLQSPRYYTPQWRPRHAPRGISPHQRNGSKMSQYPTQQGNNEEHWCETCDRGFPTADILNGHKQQHQKCNIDGCQFVAHPKVITKHIQMQHSSGLYKKISKLNNPEEIQKWREERKKKYPTRSNIEKKAAEHKEKIERGEKMALKNNNNCRMDHKNTSDNSRLKRKNDYIKRNGNNKINGFDHKGNNTGINIKKEEKIHPPQKKIKVIPTAPKFEKNRLKPFSGILSIVDIFEDTEDAQSLDNTNCIIECDDYEPQTESIKTENNRKPVLCGALSSLICEYGSSDEDNIQDNENNQSYQSAIVPQKSEMNTISKLNNSPEIHNIITKAESLTNVTHSEQAPIENVSSKNDNEIKSDDDDSGPEEVMVEKIDINESETVKGYNKSYKMAHIRGPKCQVGQRHQKFQRKIPSTLLQKLLHKEIRHERNIVLQCIKYIRKNNYFET